MAHGLAKSPEACAPSPLISEGYRKQQEALHEQGNYGTASITFAPMVSQIIERMGITHLLDYGCGANVNLSKHLALKHKVTYQAYDPAVPRFSRRPFPAQLVCCIDVLEHIEPDCLDQVLDDLAALAEGVAFLSVCTAPALKRLQDGRNAHLIQQPIEWWLPKLWRRFELQTVQVVSEESFFVIGLAKPRLEAVDGSQLV